MKLGKNLHCFSRFEKFNIYNQNVVSGEFNAVGKNNNAKTSLKLK